MPRNLSDAAWESYCEAERAACEAAAGVLRKLEPLEVLAIRDTAEGIEGGDFLADCCSFVLGDKDVPEGWNVARVSSC